jgi:outer membrane biosynthesis protein TonB
LNKQRSLTVFLDNQRAKKQRDRSDRKAYTALKLQQSIRQSMDRSVVVVVPSGGGVQDHATRMIEDNYREHRTAHVANTKQRELLANKRVQLRLTERKAKNEARQVAAASGKTKAKDATQDIMLLGPLKPPPKPPRKPTPKQPPKPKLPPKQPPKPKPKLPPKQKQKRKRPKNVGENNEEHPTRNER